MNDDELGYFKGEVPLFNKNKNKKAVVDFTDKSEGSSISSTTIPLKDHQFLEYLRELYLRYGDLVIKYISEDGQVDLQTKGASILEETEERLQEIEQAIHDYVKGRALEVEVYVVFNNGKFEGVFNREALAMLKMRSLISRGTPLEDVTIEPIVMNSFKNPLNDGLINNRIGE